MEVRWTVCFCLRSYSLMKRIDFVCLQIKHRIRVSDSWQDEANDQMVKTVKAVRRKFGEWLNNNAYTVAKGRLLDQNAERKYLGFVLGC